MTAIRSVHTAEGKFVQIANAAMQDRRLSFTARGILAYILSLPPDHHLTSEWLESQATESRRIMRAALRELETFGYYRKTKKSGGRGAWAWEHVMSDAPMADDGERTGEDVFPQVVSSDHHRSDVNRSDVIRSDKDLKTEEPKHEDQKMAQERASRRAQASGSRTTRTRSEVIADVRKAVAQVHGEDDAGDLTDGQVLGLYYAYANPDKRPVRDLVAYMSRILEDAPYLETFVANAGAVCIPCNHWESDCRCGQESAA